MSESLLTAAAPSTELAAESQSGKVGRGLLLSRLTSLDAYRGLAMVLMACDGLGVSEAVGHGGGNSFWRIVDSQADHVPWRGGGVCDMIQPSFTFIVGVALPFSLARRKSLGQSFGGMTFHAMIRSLLLICLGIFLRSIGKHQTYFTFEDTLTQIGLGYTFVFMLAWARPRTQAIAALLILLGYWLAFALHPLPAPGFDRASVGVTAAWQAEHGLNGFAAHWDKNTNLAVAVDQWFLNLFPREHRFVYNAGGYATLSFIPTLATMILGLLAGELLHSGQKAGRNFLILLGAGVIGVLLGWAIDLSGVCPLVKRIWTPSWTIYSAGWCSLVMAFFYATVDWPGWKRWTFPLVVVGMNSIAMYCMADGGVRSFILSSFHTHLGPYHVFQRILGPYSGYSSIAEATAALAVLWLICLWMYRRKIFLRI